MNGRVSRDPRLDPVVDDRLAVTHKADAKAWGFDELLVTHVEDVKRRRTSETMISFGTYKKQKPLGGKRMPLAVFRSMFKAAIVVKVGGYASGEL